MGNLGSGAGEIRRYAHAWLARCHLEQGRWSEAGTAAASLAAERLTMTPSRIVALTVLGRLRSRRGDPGAREPLQEAWELAARPTPSRGRRLAGGGLRNLESAGRLHISEKTVDHHVSAILAKLGVRSRREATRAAAARGIGSEDGEPATPT